MLGPAGKMAVRPARRQDALLSRPLKPAGPKRRRRNTLDRALRPNLANGGKSSNATPPPPRNPIQLMSDASVSSLDYSRTLYLPKTDFPDARRPAAEGAGDSGPLGAGESLWGAARSWPGPAEIRAARRAALRQRQCPHRHGAQQDAEGHCRALASDDGAGIQLRSRLGLSRAPDRMEGRGGILPRQGQDEA